MLKHLYESQQLEPEIIFKIFDKTDELIKKPFNSLNGKVLATLFYEPSTRTRLSFESAMLRLGGSVISTENAKEFSSAIKGESLEDTIRIVSGYADCIVIRHYEDGAAKKASFISDIPIINAGDGSGQHPTQALLDIYTIYKEIGRLRNFKIAMVGDLAHGRTVRSLSYLIGKLGPGRNIEIIFISPDNLKMKDDLKEYLERHEILFREETDMNNVLSECDIVYMTRIQKERMSTKDYLKSKGKYVIDMKNIHLIKNEARIMHPLPHVEEIDLPIAIEQGDPRIAYFRQARNGLFIRMALLDYLINKK